MRNQITGQTEQFAPPDGARPNLPDGKNSFNCLMAGIGGQGVVFASKTLAETAVSLGCPARTAETIGMAQRGGAVTSHVRLGRGVFSPLISRGQAQLIMGFEPAETVRVLPYLTSAGTVVVCDEAVTPAGDPRAAAKYQARDMIDCLAANTARLLVISGALVRGRLGSMRTLNMVLLGAVRRLLIPTIQTETLAAVVRRKAPARFIEGNLAALALGEYLAGEWAGGAPEAEAFAARR
jgi:indolepyruvate ferredoxin oxidoreductase beta subunit